MKVAKLKPNKPIRYLVEDIRVYSYRYESRRMMIKDIMRIIRSSYEYELLYRVHKGDINLYKVIDGRLDWYHFMYTKCHINGYPDPYVVAGDVLNMLLKRLQ